MPQPRNTNTQDNIPKPIHLLAMLPVINFEKKELSPQLAEIPLEKQVFDLANLSMEKEIDEVLQMVLDALNMLE